MKTLAPQFTALLIVAFALFSCSQDEDGIYFDNNATQNEIVDLSKTSYTSLEADVLALVNQHRESIGLQPLTTLNLVSGVAKGHTEYMIVVGEPNHDNFAQRSQQLMQQASAKSVGENVAYGYSTAQGVVNAWLNSPEHKAIIENPNYTHFGISTEANTENRNFYTNIFIEK